MTAEGSIREQPLPEVLLALGREDRTGILTIQGQKEIIAFSFLKGRVVSADALNQTMEDGLGVVLSDLDLVSGHQFAELAAEYQAGGGQVVDLLVERGFVEREELLDAVRTHILRLCRQALEWSEGEYKFYQGEEVSYEEGVLPIPPEELLIHASRDAGQELVSGGIPADDDVFTAAKGAQPPEALDGDVHEPAALEAFGLLDGANTLAEAAAESGLSVGRLAYLIKGWQEQGLVEEPQKGRSRKAKPKAESRSKPPKKGRAEKRASASPRESRLVAWWRELRQRPPSEAYAWPPRVLGVALMALLGLSFAAAPSDFLLPFPWQGGLRQGLDREHLGAELQRLRQANNASFLLHARFAESLADLERGGLLPGADLVDERDHALSYSATAASYVVRSSVEVGSDSETYLQETTRGNFLLDPELELPVQSRRAPLVLLD
jgi:hypothetical protein